jgi:NADH-quinone oxidoreductase subunit L
MTHGILNFLKMTPSLAYSTIAETGGEPKFHWDVAITSTGVVVLGIALAAYFYLGGLAQANFMAGVLKPLYVLSHRKFFIDEIYQATIVWPLRMLATIGYWVDRYVIDALVNLIGALPGAGGWMLRSLQNGMVQFYALAMILGLLVLIGALALWPVG